MNIIIHPIKRHEKLTGLWTCIVNDGGKTIFDDSWVSIKFHSESSAQWFADIVGKLHKTGVNLQCKSILQWKRDLEGDCILNLGNIYAHAEHLEGPLGKGGIWYCMVEFNNTTYFHTADHAIQPRSGKAARWLAEVMILAIQNDVMSQKDL